MQERFFEPTGIAYRSNGLLPNRPTLVLIHGLSGSLSAWYPFETELNSELNLVTVDLVGHGLSRKPKNYKEYSITAHALAIEQLLTHLSVNDFILLSHSLGTLVALELFTRKAIRPSALIFLSPTYQLCSVRLSWITRMFARMGAALFGVLPYDSRTIGRTDYTKFPKSGDWNVPRMCSDLTNTSLRSYFYSFSSLYEFDDEPKWATIHVPTLIMHGRKDSLVPLQQALRLHEKIGHSRLIILDDADHIIPLNNVLDVCDAIREFVRVTSS